MKSNIVPGSLGEALTVVEVAITLGAELPAPKGSFFFLATKDHAQVERVIGYFDTEEEAKKSIRVAIMERFERGFSGPWVSDLVRMMKWDDSPAGKAKTLIEYNKNKEDYFKENDIEEFYKNREKGYYIKKVFIKGKN